MEQNKKKTPVEWLAEKYNYVTWLLSRDEISAETAEEFRSEYLAHAKKMEEDALFDCWVASHEAYMTSENYREKKEFDKYYQKTYEQ
jgi:hypothetical protein